jgi:hypothetical protein
MNREAKMEEIQAKEKSRKNWTVRFWIAEYPILPEQIEFEYGLKFSLFMKDLIVSDLKSYILLRM